MFRSRDCLFGWVLVGLLAGWWPSPAAEPPREKPATKPPWQRFLQGEDARKANELVEQWAQFYGSGKYEEALKKAEALADLRVRAQGTDHWEAVDARWAAETLRRVLRQGNEARNEFSRALSLFQQSQTLENKGRYQEAQLLLEKNLAIYRQVLGEEHPVTAGSYNNLSFNLNAQTRNREAEDHSRKALAIFRKVLGEEHPDTGTGYDSLANTLFAQGKYREAESNFRQALASRQRALGDEDPLTALVHNNIASSL